MKKGKQLKINSLKNYNLVLGSVNNKNSKAIYLNISAWCDPQREDSINYVRVIRDIHKKIKQVLFNNFNESLETEFIKDRTIVDLDIRESGVRYGKRSFMNCEITLFLKNEIPVNSDIMKPLLDNVTNLIIESAFESNRYFKFYKKKI